MEGFRKVLLHDLTAEQFGDMYAQTICYGLFCRALQTALARTLPVLTQPMTCLKQIHFAQTFRSHRGAGTG